MVNKFTCKSLHVGGGKKKSQNFLELKNSVCSKTFHSTIAIYIKKAYRRVFLQFFLYLWNYRICSICIFPLKNNVV